MNFNQAKFDIRCEWGIKGVRQLAPISDAVIIVDILSFSTCIDIANNRGAVVFPYQWKDESAQKFARTVGAKVAGKRGSGNYSLSPTSLLSVDKETRLILPSPNGSSLSLATMLTPTLTSCLRNCKAVALSAMNYGKKIAVIPAGERWSDNTLRPSFEDFVGAGAVINYLKGSLSPEAQIAVTAYQNIRLSIVDMVKQCSSGKELIERGFEQDIDLALQINVSNSVPTLINGMYKNYARQTLDSRRS